MKGILIALGVVPLLTVPVVAQFGPWTSVAPVGAPVNGPFDDTCVSISKNRLSLYFASARSGSGGLDLFVSTRQSVADPWGEPVNLAQLNSAVQDSCPALSLDEHRLFFASARTGMNTCGGIDLYVSRRHDRRDDLGWQAPVNLGCVLNSPRNDFMPVFFEDEDGDEIMYFRSNRHNGPCDIYQSRLGPHGEFEPATAVTELNSLYVDGGPAVRRDGLEIIFFSNRPPSQGADLWTSTRSSTRESWSPPVLVPDLSTPYFEGNKMSFSFDGTELYFASNRANPSLSRNDIYVATRSRPGRR